MRANVIAVLRLVLCAIRHPRALAERYGSVRCNVCNPIRHVARPRPEAPLLDGLTEAGSEDATSNQSLGA
jgi:hypothetical protein